VGGEWLSPSEERAARLGKAKAGHQTGKRVPPGNPWGAKKKGNRRLNRLENRGSLIPKTDIGRIFPQTMRDCRQERSPLRLREWDPFGKEKGIDGRVKLETILSEHR